MFILGFQNFLYVSWTKNIKFGGLIGYGNSRLDSVICYSKLFRLHSFLLDAAGAVRLQTGKGPSYGYMIGRGPNCCLLGHVTGLLYSSLRKNLSTLHFRFNRILSQYVLHCTRKKTN